MSNKKTAKNDVILAIRMPAQLLYQLNALAESKYMGTATMARNVLAQYLTDEAPKALLGATTQPKPQGKVLTRWEQERMALSPSERAKQDAEYEADWG